MVAHLLLSVLGCDTRENAIPREVATARAFEGACDGAAATYEGCRAWCASLTEFAERNDCNFQMAERAPRWSSGDARKGVELVYTLCNATRDFSTQCFRHGLHELALTCTQDGRPLLKDATFNGGSRWAKWQSCVAQQVLERQKAACLPAVRDNYHNMWEADDAPLCGL